MDFVFSRKVRTGSTKQTARKWKNVKTGYELCQRNFVYTHRVPEK